MKSFSLELTAWENGAPNPPPASPLEELPPLPRLERLKMRLFNVRAPHFHHLSTSPRLRSLCLDLTCVNGAGLAELATLPNLEQLTLEDDVASPDVLNGLQAVKRLKTLRLSGPGQFDGDVELDDGSSISAEEGDVFDFRRAIDDLRRAVPGIRIEDGNAALDAQWAGQPVIPAQYEPIQGVRSFARDCLRVYKEINGKR